MNEGLEKLVTKDSHPDEDEEHQQLGMFYGSGLEEIVLPGTLREVCDSTFNYCNNLQTIWIRDGCTADVKSSVMESVKILPMRDTMVGSLLLWDLRALKNINLPEGIQKIGNYWFRGSDIESVVIPASVKEIGSGTFLKCASLKRIIFANGSILQTIGAHCFE